MVFPFDFGSLPGVIGGDGDPMGVKEIVHFFESYPALRGKTFMVQAVRGPRAAMRLLE